MQSQRYRKFEGNNRWQADAEPELDELKLDESLVALDEFNSDLNVVVDRDGYGGTVLNDPSGFCFTWAGVRATYGVCQGKVFYEVHVLEHLPVDFGDDHQETDPHVIRLGWSIDSSSFQLGEEPWSFGYGGTGKFSTNNRFSDYGVRFEEGDVIGAMLDLDSRPASISFMKNGTWYGVAAPLHGFPVGSKKMALFPHILSKNCKFKVNFGQQDAWFPPPPGFRYIGHLPVTDRVRGMVPPATKSDCEMIMIVGLPGSGKTTWGLNMQKNHPEKRYNIIGTDTLIDKMRVMGLPRKRNYHGRWDVLIDKATKCLNKYFILAAKRRRNYILDQTNVYGSARRRKMKNFTGFYRIAAVIQPDDSELERRSKKRTLEDGKVVPESAVLEMKANYSIPEDRDNLFDRIDFIELKRDTAAQLMRMYNQEGKSKPRQDNAPNRFDENKRQDNAPNRFDVNKRPGDYRQQQYGGYNSKNYDRSSQYDKDSSLMKREHWYPDRDEVPAKRGKTDSDSALGLLKQQYEEDDRHAAAQQGYAARSNWSDSMKIKEEPGISGPNSQWSKNSGYQDRAPSKATAFQPGLLGAPPGLQQGTHSSYNKPGMPLGSELPGMGFSAKGVQEMSGPNSAQYNSGRTGTGSPYNFGSQSSGQNKYGGYESLGNPDSNRQPWQSERGQDVQSKFYPGGHQQHVPSWQQGQADAMGKLWEQEKSSNSWQSDYPNRQDERGFEKRDGNRDSSYNYYDSKDRERGDRDTNKDRDNSYNRDKIDDRGYGGNNRDRGRPDVGFSGSRDGVYGDRDGGYSDRRNGGLSDRQDGGYGDRRDGGYGDRRDGSYNDRRDQGFNSGSRDTNSSWNNQNLARTDPQATDYEKGDRQMERKRKRVSKWDQPGDNQVVPLDQIKKEPDMDSYGQSESGQNKYGQPQQRFSGCSQYPSTLNRPDGDHDMSYDISFAKPPPPLMGNLKTEFSAPKDSNTFENKLPPIGNKADGLLGQGPGPRPLIPGLQGNMSANQFKGKGSFSDPSSFRQGQNSGVESNLSKNNDNANSRNSDNFSSRKPFSRDDKDNNDGNKRSSPRPLIKLEDTSFDTRTGMPDKGRSDSFVNQPRGGPGKPGLFPIPGSEEDENPSFRPNGPPGLMGRFDLNDLQLMGGPGMFGPGMEPRYPRDGPRGAPFHGHMGGPPMGGGPRGQGPWNQNNPRFGPRGFQGPPRPFFDGPAGRW